MATPSPPQPAPTSRPLADPRAAWPGRRAQTGALRLAPASREPAPSPPAARAAPGATRGAARTTRRLRGTHHSSSRPGPAPAGGWHGRLRLGFPLPARCSDGAAAAPAARSAPHGPAGARLRGPCLGGGARSGPITGRGGVGRGGAANPAPRVVLTLGAPGALGPGCAETPGRAGGFEMLGPGHAEIGFRGPAEPREGSAVSGAGTRS